MLLHVELSEVRKQYYALSYVWGNPKKVHTISLNGQDLQVTDNLMFFLRRKRTVTLAFRIDAICINQEDKAEKSEQIGRMAEIYKNASSVYVELGPASEDEQRIFGNIEYLSYFTFAEMQRIESEAGRTKASVGDIRLPPEFVEPYDAQMWEGLDSFFTRPWWNRVWIMQEATAVGPEKTHLLCGEVEVSLLNAWSCGIAVSLAYRQQIQGHMPKPSTFGHIGYRMRTLQRKREEKVMMPVGRPGRLSRTLGHRPPRHRLCGTQHRQ